MRPHVFYHSIHSIATPDHQVLELRRCCVGERFGERTIGDTDGLAVVLIGTLITRVENDDVLMTLV